MRSRRFVLAFVLILLPPTAALTPLAYASPPDPAWIQGVYDAADYDDVVVLITSGAGVAELFLVMDLRPVPRLGGCAPQLDDRLVPRLVFWALRPRAPPIFKSLHSP